MACILNLTDFEQILNKNFLMENGRTGHLEINNDCSSGTNLSVVTCNMDQETRSFRLMEDV